jgi:hypothetical protein
MKKAVALSPLSLMTEQRRGSNGRAVADAFLAARSRPISFVEPVA